MQPLNNNIISLLEAKEHLLKAKSKKENLKYFLLSLFFFSLLFGLMTLEIPGIYNVSETNIKNINTVFIFSLIFSIVVYFITHSSINYELLKNEGDVSLYDALFYIHRDKNKNPEDLNDTVDVEYEKFCLLEIMSLQTSDKATFNNKKEEITKKYQSKEVKIPVFIAIRYAQNSKFKSKN